MSAFRSGPLAWAEDLVQDLVRDGARAGITVLVAGERELVTARFFAAVPNRIFLPAGSTEEGRLGWPRLPVLDAGAGRVVVFGPISPASSPAGHVGQLFGPRSPASRDGKVTLRTRPFRVEPLPKLVTVADVLSRTSDPSPPPGHVCLGVGGDERPPVGHPAVPGRRPCRSRRPGVREDVAAVSPAGPQSRGQLASGPVGDGSGAVLVGRSRSRLLRRPGPGSNSPGGRPRSAVARSQQPADPAEQARLAGGSHCRLQPGHPAAGSAGPERDRPGSRRPDRPAEPAGRRTVRRPVRPRAESSAGAGGGDFGRPVSRGAAGVRSCGRPQRRRKDREGVAPRAVATGREVPRLHATRTQ